MIEIAGRLLAWATDDRLPRIVRRSMRAAYLMTVVAASRQHGGTTAVLRLLRWWAWRMVGTTRAVEVNLSFGAALSVPRWSALGSILVATGWSQPSEQRFLLDVLRDGDQFIDVGANIGVFSVTAAARGAAVYAFEPVPKSFSWLEGNLREFDDRSFCHRAAVSRAEGVARFWIGGDVDNRLVVGSGPLASDVIEVPVTSLDSWLRSDRSGAIAFRRSTSDALVVLKIDTEGHDQEVIDGGPELIGAIRPVIIAETWGRDGGFLQRLPPSYAAYSYDDLRRQLITVHSDGRRQDTIFAPRSRLRAIARRLSEAPRIEERHQIDWRPQARTFHGP